MKKELRLVQNIIKKMFLSIIYLIYTCTDDLALNNLQWLICHKTKPNQINHLSANRLIAPIHFIDPT